MLALVLDPADGPCMFHRNVGPSPNYTALQLRRSHSSQSCLVFAFFWGGGASYLTKPFQYQQCVYIASDGRIIDELERIRKNRHYPCICLERLMKTTNNFSQVNQCSGRKSNRTSREYKHRALRLDQIVRCLMFQTYFCTPA